MGLYTKFENDEELDTKGTFLQIDDKDRPLLRIRLARAGGLNKKFTAALERVKKQYAKLFAHDMVSDARNREIMMEVHADTTVLEWFTWDHKSYDDKGVSVGEWVPGIEDETGGIIPFTRENVIKTFRALPSVYEMAVEHAGDGQLYNRAYIEASVKNS